MCSLERSQASPPLPKLQSTQTTPLHPTPESRNHLQTQRCAAAPLSSRKHRGDPRSTPDPSPSFATAPAVLPTSALQLQRSPLRQRTPDSTSSSHFVQEVRLNLLLLIGPSHALFIACVRFQRSPDLFSSPASTLACAELRRSGFPSA